MSAKDAEYRLSFFVRFLRKALPLFVAWVGIISPLSVPAVGIIDSKHNLSATSGPAERGIMAVSETRVCIFCHTPHNAAPRTPLWNKAENSTYYIPYSSSTMRASPGQPTGPSRLCLSCHDGTVALGTVLNPASGIQLNVGRIAPGTLTYIGTDLSNSHPISFSYLDSISNPLAGLSPIPPPGVILYGNLEVQCPTCHDAHADNFRSPDMQGLLTGKFLVANNISSGLCVVCHSSMYGWNTSSHSTSTASVAGVLPLTTNEKIRDWPTWQKVTEWGCESCHAPHGAGGAERLLYYQEEEKNCYFCHNGRVASKNVEAQFQRLSRHPVDLTTIGMTADYHDPKEDISVSARRHVECVDCHNPHAANGTRSASAPFVSGMLDGVSGIRIDNTETGNATNEYEICFRCHGQYAPQNPFIPRVINLTDMRLAFSPSNQSYHPIAATGRNSDPPPSLDPPSQDPGAPLNLSWRSLIYCTDCHSDDSGGSRGPHGSNFAPILGRRYETIMGTPATSGSYSLCYRCHNETSIMLNASFKQVAGKGGHSGHVQTTQAPCSVCHDPHGVSLGANLVNFDTRYVKGPNDADLPPPTFTEGGAPFSGSCNLVCHYNPGDYNVKMTHVNVLYQ